MELSSVLLFFNIGAPELFIIVFVIIVFFGSKKIPELMRGLGKGMREFKNATGEIQNEIRKSTQDIQRDLKDSNEIRKSTEDTGKDSKDSKSESGDEKL